MNALNELCVLIFLDSIIQESEAGNPCHDGTEEEAPTGAYTCNQNVSVCLGKIYLDAFKIPFSSNKKTWPFKIKNQHFYYLISEKWVGPNNGITSFDNIFLAMLTVFQVNSS